MCPSARHAAWSALTAAALFAFFGTVFAVDAGTPVGPRPRHSDGSSRATRAAQGAVADSVHVPAQPTCSCTPPSVTPTPEACPREHQWVVAAGGAAAVGASIVGGRDTLSPTADQCRAFAFAAEIGHVYGLAYDLDRDVLYAAAHYRPCAPLGPGGPGAVYRIDLRALRIEVLATIDAGTADPGSDAACRDEDHRALVGKTGLGDLDLAEDGRSLYVVNLHDRQIYNLSTADGRILRTIATEGDGEPWGVDARPFALAFRDGWLFHGVIDARERDPAGGPPHAYVFRSRPDGSTMGLALELSLDYRADPQWTAWHMRPGIEGPLASVQPILSDIDFRPDGDMILGLRAREVDMYERTHSAYGDVLPTRGRGRLRWEAITQPEFYRDDRSAPELAFGGLAAALSGDRVIATVRDPVGDAAGAGLLWFDNERGQVDGPADGRELLLACASPWLGDVEVACLARAPSVPSPTASATSTSLPTATASPSATATAVPPTPTSTATPVPSATPSATRTSTSTPIPEYRAYLPLAHREPCKPQDWYSDVVLVLDMSTSMRRPTSAGRSKHAATIEAAKWFVANLPSLAPDAAAPGARLGVVGFNDEAWIEQDLTHDTAALHAALDRLPRRIAEGTRLDLAIQRGAQATSGPIHRPDNRKVVLLLTDGLPNRVPLAPDGSMESTVLTMAQSAKADGNTIYTIAIGAPQDTNADLLRSMATRADMYYYMPDAEDLEDVYARIVGTWGCP